MRPERAAFRLALIRLLLRAGRSGHRFINLRQARAYFELAGRMLSVGKKGLWKEISAGGVKGEWIGPDLAEADRIIFYLHGGAFVSGSPRTHRHLVLRIAQEASASALVIDYRLAPEFPYPAALDDALSAYCWLLGQNCPSRRIAIAGDSSGGGLAVSLLQRLIKENVTLPACAALISPWVDLSSSGESYFSRASRDPMVRRELCLERALWYAAGRDLRDPEISPLWGDLAGLPPLLILVGSDEVLYDDSFQLTEKARRAGVAVDFEVWPGMFHVWPYIAPLLPQGQEACARIGLFIRRQIP